MIAAVTKSLFVLYFGDIPVFKSLAGYLCIVMFLDVQKKRPQKDPTANCVLYMLF